MKAYKDSKGDIRLFRPLKNWERFARSSRRLTLPDCDSAGFLESIRRLVEVDRRWVPEGRGYSLYLRPTMIATQTSLGVGPSAAAKFFVIMSPVGTPGNILGLTLGPYYPEGWKAVKLLADETYVRAWPGGVGASKVGGNYAPGILPQVEAAGKGYSQILWLYGPSQQITEVGTMNFFLFWKNAQGFATFFSLLGERELITPPLEQDLILPGVTRDSVLELTRSWKEFRVVEREIRMPELIEALQQGRVLEAFGAGTAAVVSPIQTIHFRGKDYSIPLDVNDAKAPIGPLAKRVADTIMDIQV